MPKRVVQDVGLPYAYNIAPKEQSSLPLNLPPGPPVKTSPFAFSPSSSTSIDSMPKSVQPVQLYWPHELERPVQNEKNRLRVSKACDRCRVQKIKCTGTYPCSTCTKHKKTCNYTTVSTQPPAKRPKVGNLTPDSEKLEQRPLEPPAVLDNTDASYVQYLEHRVRYLESLVNQERVPVAEPSDLHRHMPSNCNTNTSYPSKWRSVLRQQNALVVELAKQMYETLSEQSKQLVRVPRFQFFGWNLLGMKYTSTSKLPDLPEFELPVESAVYVDYFFREINCLYSILHESMFREQIAAYDKLRQEEQANSEPKSNQTTLFTALLCLIYLLAIRFTEFSSPAGPRVQMLDLECVLFKYSYEVISQLSFEWTTFELIQGWLLITLYLRTTHRQTSSYAAMGHAVTMSKSMGLTRGTYSFFKTSLYDKMKAANVFWAVLTLDRLLAVQSGRVKGLHHENMAEAYPSMDYELHAKTNDWVLKPAFFLYHLSQFASAVPDVTVTSLTVPQIEIYTQKLEELDSWLNANGFSDDEIFSGTSRDGISDMVKTQVKLYYYDLIVCIHGRILFHFLGKTVVNPALRSEVVVDTGLKILALMRKVLNAGLLFTPWYQNLMLTFNSGINALTLIHGGVFIQKAKAVLAESMSILTAMSNSPVTDEDGQILTKDRFTMVKECLWALKMSNRMLSLKIQETYSDLTNIGIDHGPSGVNRLTFGHFSMLHPGEDRFVIDKIKKKETDEKLTQLSSENAPNSNYDPDILSALQWFDQWVDINSSIE